MVTTIELLSNQHQEVLARLAEVESHLGAGDGYDCAGFVGYLENDVMRHFSMEEEALFPVLARHLSLAQGPLAVMNAEHASFRELLQRLASGVRVGDIGQQRADAQDLIDLLRGHIAKEDHVLFPMATQILNAAEQGEVESRAAALGTGAALQQS